MPSEIQPVSEQTRVRTLLAPVIELQFSLYALERSGVHRGPWPQPWIASFLQQHRELADRVATFWGGEERGEWSDLIILAERAGVLFEPDPEATWQRLADAAAKKIVVPPLPAEQPYVQPLLQHRVDQLRESADLRERYIAIIREAWAALKPYWESTGHPAAEQLLQHIRPQLARDADVRTVLPANHFARREGMAEIVNDAIERSELVVVPLGMAGVGIAFFALPGIVIAALGPDSEKKAAFRRERAERGASRFKLLSDPTRLNLLSVLLRYPHSITDLASKFELSQPTVSEHIKMLREAGLLDSHKEKGHTLYSASEERTRALLDEGTAALFEDLGDC
jgi:ArsR family transcriptional regulator